MNENLKFKPCEKKYIIIKDSKYYKEKCKNILKISPIYIGFIVTYWFYFLSLEACYKGEGICSNNFYWIKKKVFEEIISCLFFETIIQLIILKKISKIHLFHIIITFMLFYIYSHGMDFENHGYFNFCFYFIIVAILTLIMIPFDIIIICIKRNKNTKLLLIYLGILFSFAFFFIYLFNYKSNCFDWPKGLNNTYIENNKAKNGCQIQIPKKCTYKIFGYIQDYTKLIGKDCQTSNNKKIKEIFFSRSRSPYIKDTTRRIGFPLTNKNPESIRNFYKFTLDNLVDMDNQELLDNYYKEAIPEIEVDILDDDKGKIIIDLKFNKTLSEERKFLENNSKPYSNNILLLYIDSLSRANAIRQLKKTMNFFENFMPYKGGFNEKFPHEVFHGFQFFKYHSFTGYTFSNYPFLFYGQKRRNKNKNLFTKFLKENGYITSTANDFCHIDNTITYHNYSLKDAFDYQYLVCDPNSENGSKNTIRCLYGKQNIEHLLNFTEQFWRKYKNNRKYASIITNYGHEGTLTVIKYIDDIIADFLNRLFGHNLLKDTSIILLSDHGVGMPSIYYIYDFFQTEIHLPSFFIITNDRKNLTYEEQYEFIQDNQQTFITAFDIYNTIGNIIYGDDYVNIHNKTLNKDTFKSELGISLFNKINPKNRFPKNYTSYSGISTRVCI